MPRKKPAWRYAICIDNGGYPASLELHKVYRVMADPAAAARRLVRVVDESGEDYLYPTSRFAPVELPRAAKAAFAAIARNAR